MLIYGLTVKERGLRIHAVVPKVLKQLYEQQNHKCDLCPYPIQDLIVAEMDHSIPVLHFARLPIPLEDAIRQANDLSNLKAVHAFCNSSKHRKTRTEWFAKKLNTKVPKPKILTDGQLLELQFRLGAAGRLCVEKGIGIGAPGMSAKGGRAAVEQKRGVHAPDYDRVVHQEKVLATMGPGGLSERARKRARTLGPEGLAAANRKRARTLGPERLSEIMRKGKATMGPEGRKATARKIVAAMKKNGTAAISNHSRWHVARGIFDAHCKPCCESRGMRYAPPTPKQKIQWQKQSRKRTQHLYQHVKRGIISDNCSLCQAA